LLAQFLKSPYLWAFLNAFIMRITLIKPEQIHGN
jgi:hypothetical protein